MRGRERNCLSFFWASFFLTSLDFSFLLGGLILFSCKNSRQYLSKTIYLPIYIWRGCICMSGTYKSKPSQFFYLIPAPVSVSLCDGDDNVGSPCFPEIFSGQFNGASERNADILFLRCLRGGG